MRKDGTILADVPGRGTCRIKPEDLKKLTEKTKAEKAEPKKHDAAGD